MSNTEKAAEQLLNLTTSIAQVRAEVEHLQERRNQLQALCHEQQIELAKLQGQRSDLLVQMGVPLIVTNNPSREALDGILKIIEGKAHKYAI